MSIEPAVAAIGFTGTRYGMTVAQRRTLRSLLANGAGREFHHGDCVGADAEAHDIAVALGIEPVIHPPVIDILRAMSWFRARSFLGARMRPSKPPRPQHIALDRSAGRGREGPVRYVVDSALCSEARLRDCDYLARWDAEIFGKRSVERRSGLVTSIVSCPSATPSGVVRLDGLSSEASLKFGDHAFLSSRSSSACSATTSLSSWASRRGALTSSLGGGAGGVTRKALLAGFQELLGPAVVRGPRQCLRGGTSPWSGISVSSSLLEGYDEPEILPSSSR